MEFEIKQLSDCEIITEWMNDTQESFDFLRIKTKEIANKYFEFAGSISDVGGIHIEYDAIDNDNVGVDIVKWSVTISISEAEGFTEELKGVDDTEYYKVIQLDGEEVLHYGTWLECLKFIDNHYPEFDKDNEECMMELNKRVRVDYSESKKHIEIRN